MTTFCRRQQPAIAAFRDGYRENSLKIEGNFGLKAEKTNARGIKTKRLCSGWDNDYLLKVLVAGN